MPSKSKFAAALRKHGFKPLLHDALELNRMREAVNMALLETKPELRPVLKGSGKPGFCYTDLGKTVARDEQGAFWIAPGRVNLSDEGFKDATIGIALLKSVIVKK